MDLRKIIHVDMDAFFAAVEQRNNPLLKGRPVIVGGAPGERGVVAACSYEARKYGIHSAMPSSTAYRLCPRAVFLRGNYEEYKRVSGQIRDIFLDYTDLVEPLSLDEAFLDVTTNRPGIPSATECARQIKARILSETGLTSSAGVSYNKFLAKVASDFRKPDGLTVVVPERAALFLDRLPIGKFHGVGQVTEKKMLELGIRTGADLRLVPREELVRIFGKTGAYYHDIVRGIDERPVEPHRIRKSIGNETTLREDIEDVNRMAEVLEELSENVSSYCRKKSVKGRTVSLKVKFSDFVCVTRSITCPRYANDSEFLSSYAKDLLACLDLSERKVRLLGVSLSNLDWEEEQGAEGQLFLPFPSSS